MSSKNVLYIVICCLVLILSTQAYLISDYFKTTQAGLIRESDAILEQAFHSDLDHREIRFRHLTGKDTIEYAPVHTQENSVFINADDKNISGEDIMKNLDLMINSFVSETVPLAIQDLDSITEGILRSRNIRSDFVVSRIDAEGRVIEQSRDDSAASFFSVSSKIFPLNLENTAFLRLTLLNPFGIIVQRMALMLIGSLVFSVICIFAFRFLLQILARQKQLMAIKNDFFGSTAHELKRPVARLHMAVNSLASPRIDGDREKKERYWAVSKEAVAEMSAKIDMIMTLSMAEEGIFRLSVAEFDLSATIRALKEQFQVFSEKEVGVNTESLPESLMIKGDETHIRQCIANLIDNAVKYSGAVVDIVIALRREGKSVYISVKDNGIGIAPDKREMVFEKYARINTGSAAPSGFGIGLNYVKTVIEKHRGQVSLTSEVGKGSEFVLSLPVRM